MKWEDATSCVNHISLQKFIVVFQMEASQYIDKKDTLIRKT